MTDINIETAPKKTAFRMEKEAHDMQIYKDYEEFMKYPGAQPGAANEFIMKKYKIHAPSTIWFIRKRVEKRLKNENNQQ